MTTITHNTPLTPAQPRSRHITRWTVFRALLWRQWILHREALLWMFSTWLIGVWILVLFNHPVWFLIVGAIFANMLSQAMAGADLLDGSEEFAVSLPVSRREYFIARMVLGLIAVAAFCGLGVALMYFNAPQRLWGLIVETGFTESISKKNWEPGYLIPISVLGPLAYFSSNYWNVALCKTKRAIQGAGGTTIIILGAVVGIAFVIEFRFWEQLIGYVVCPLLAIMTIGPLWMGYVACGVREIVSSESQES